MMKVSEELQEINCTHLHVAIESTIRTRGMNYFVGDVTVGRPYSGCDDVEYPLGNPPVAVCEITSSTNLNNDFKKSSTYASIGVEEYVIVHIHVRDYQSGHPYGIYVYSDLRVEAGNSSYASVQFVNEGTIRTTHFGQLEVETMKDPPRN